MEENTQQKREAWDWSKHRPNNMFNINTTPERNFFKWWCTFLKPFVPLTPKEIDVVAAYLKQRFELAKVISDPVVLDSQLMSTTTKDKVIEECNMTLQHYYVVMSSLRKSNVITEAGINPKLIPSIKKDDNGTFQLLINFNGVTI
jgi:hypothetical protein